MNNANEFQELFENTLEKKIENDYQRKFFLLAWDDFMSDSKTKKFISQIEAIFDHTTKQTKYVTRIKFILIIIQMGLQLLDNLKTSKLSSDFQKFDKNLIMLTAFNFVATLPYLLITETCKSESKCITALNIINDFLGEHLFDLHGKKPLTEIDCKNLYGQLVVTLI